MSPAARSVGQWDKHTSASDTQPAAAQFFAQYINICWVALCSRADENHVFFHSHQLHSVLFIQGTAHGHSPSQSHSLLSLLGSAPCGSHQEILGRWCRAVLLYPTGAEGTGLPCTTHCGYRENMPSGIFSLSLSITFCFGFNSSKFLNGEERIKENFTFLMSRLSVLTKRKAIGTELLILVLLMGRES